MLDGKLDRLFGHGERMRLVLAVADDLGERGTRTVNPPSGSGRKTTV